MSQLPKDEAKQPEFGHPHTDQQAADRIDWAGPLLDVAEMLARGKWILMGSLALGLALGFLRLSMTPPFYRASTVALLMSREKSNLDAAIDTSSIETTDGSAGRSSAGNLMLPPEPSLYTTLIHSPAVLHAIAEQFEQQLSTEISQRDRSDEILMRLKNMLSITSTEEGLITVTVTSASAQLSAELANALVRQAQQASQQIEQHLLLQQAGYLSQAHAESLQRLADTEAKVVAFTSKHRLIDPQLQLSNLLRHVRELSLRQDTLLQERASLLSTHTEASSAVRALDERLLETRRQQGALESEMLGGLAEHELAGLLQHYQTLLQQLQFERDLSATLGAKAGIYRIRAEQPTGSLAVIKQAQPNHRPAGPSKKKIIGLTCGFCLVLGGLLVVLLHQWRCLRQQPEVARRIDHVVHLLINPIKPASKPSPVTRS
jgi:uncharacterized protein involved in exopolysaccharide biosynthesis